MFHAGCLTISWEPQFAEKKTPIQNPIGAYLRVESDPLTCMTLSDELRDARSIGANVVTILKHACAKNRVESSLALIKKYFNLP